MGFGCSPERAISGVAWLRLLGRLLPPRVAAADSSHRHTRLDGDDRDSGKARLLPDRVDLGWAMGGSLYGRRQLGERLGSQSEVGG